ncbi:MAG: DUF3750 domain-containing protein [Nanoarchaeota archaeon]|nr:DUF3750 domain-containing protein [Nanoarchaeota archaeon]
MDSLDDAISKFNYNSHNSIVGLFGSKIVFPLDITHHWFVVKHGDNLRRVEVLGYLSNSLQKGNKAGLTYSKGEEFEGLYVNPLTYKFPLIPSPKFESFNSGIIEGGKNSLAHKLSLFILDRSWEYPFLDEYEGYPSQGPNSNTYTSWVLRQFPRVEQKLVLPSTAHGKDFQGLEEKEIRYGIAAE